MKATTYDRLVDENHQAIMEVYNKMSACTETRSALWNKLEGYSRESEEYRETYAMIERNKELSAALDEQLAALKGTQEELRLEREQGFDYERSGSRLINRLLPPIPAEAKDKRLQNVPSGILSAMTTFVMTSVLVLIVLGVNLIGTTALLGLAYLGMLLPGGATYSVSMSTIIIALAGVFCVLNGVRYLSDSFALQAVYSARQRYVLGAETWTLGQRLRSCLVYSVSDVMVLFIPLMAVPYRFCLIGFGMVSYLREVRRTNQTTALSMTAKAAHWAAGWVMVTGGFALIALVIVSL